MSYIIFELGPFYHSLNNLDEQGLYPFFRFFLKKQNFPSGAIHAIQPNFIGLDPQKLSNLI